MNKKQLIDRLHIAEKYFYYKEPYISAIDLARTSFEKGSLVCCEEALNFLPTKEKLLSQLITKLKGKSVYSTLLKIQEGKSKNDFTALKAISSLLTHCVIEVEKGNKEFGILIPEVYEKIGNFIYELEGEK